MYRQLADFHVSTREALKRDFAEQRRKFELTLLYLALANIFDFLKKRRAKTTLL